jgi:hypothetical protein
MFVKIAVCGYGGKGRVFVKIVTVACVFLAIGIYARVVSRSLNVKVAELEMPILPENKNRYPDNWKALRKKILFWTLVMAAIKKRKGALMKNGGIA